MAKWSNTSSVREVLCGVIEIPPSCRSRDALWPEEQEGVYSAVEKHAWVWGKRREVNLKRKEGILD